MVNVPMFEDDWVTENYDISYNRQVSLNVVAVISLFSIVFVFSAIFNIVFLAFYLRKSSLRNVSNKFIFNLCLCNVLKSFIILPIIITDALFYQNKHFLSSSVTQCLCTGFTVATETLLSEAIFSTALIATDRYFAITDPLHYYLTMTKNRSLILILLSWSLAVVVGIVSFFAKPINNTWDVCDYQTQDKVRWQALSSASISMFFCFLVPFAVVLWSYVKIYSAAQQNSERTRRSSVCHSNPDCTIVDLQKYASRSPSTRSGSSHIVSNIRRRLSNASLFLYKEEAKTAKISIAVVILFLICFLPFYATKLASVIMIKEPTAEYSYKIGVLFAYLNTMLSPCLYVFRSKQVKKELYKRLGISLYDYEMSKNPPYRQINFTIEPPSLSNTYVPFGREDIDKTILLNSLLTQSILNHGSPRNSFELSSTSSGSVASGVSSQLLHEMNMGHKS